MLLQEKMQRTAFSANEQAIVDFMLQQQDQLKVYGTPQLAQATYTSPSVVVRVAKKLGFSGWRALKASFLAEVEYLQTNFKNLDANQPFTAQDPLMTVAGKVTQLEIESANDTLALLDHDRLLAARQILLNAQSINVFGLANLLFSADEFVYKMRHLGKQAQTFPIQNMMFQEAAMLGPADCAIVMSYSGESDPLFTVTDILQQRQVPIIALTSIGENRLSRLADVTLKVTTRENSYRKIASFASLTSMRLILDILYSSYFASNYEQNMQFKVDLGTLTEKRPLDNHIIDDDLD
ncbi:MurR/RpiR family transcriptional regulator [Lactiplantibacillus fabifermentans]|uniref:RpiR family transcriptional regulator n=2 Tax=Lactiplantibacillus fabifermentans TaxID=483011 RepID=A0A0R2NUF8_9LACO|nr:MurR/RpiR family transcriptional regulator [Lactiplantibacillus fabifermentans]ETY75086.1 sugar isomerase [Lactiplantibacillus fabifermentans T30PCM01]KRO28956.1 RpiR family transcriptional regulator [Lactiplantibacillus fabifermentans DSM 21115]